jgi:DNA-binding beta-propeller fold protein YncE
MDQIMYGQAKILPITKAYGVAMWQGKIYVCDVRSLGVTVLDLKQHLAKAVGVGGTMEIKKAIDIAVAPDGYKFVVDGSGKAIVVLDPTDHVIARYAPPDLDPVSVAVYGNELFVVDYKAQRVKVMSRSTGEILRTIGEPGGEDGQFVRPLCVRVDPQGIVFVTDVITCRVQRFTRDGKFLSRFSQTGNLPGDLVRPKHFSFDKNGFMYIADGGFANVQVFDENQKVVGYFGSAGNHPGAMNLPVGVYVDESPDDLAMFRQYVHPAFQGERLILVTNQFGNQRVSVYALGHLKPGKTVADVAGARAAVPTGTTPPTTGPTTEPSTTEPSIMFQNPAR